MQQVQASIQADFERLNTSVASSLYTDVDLVGDIGQYIIDAGGKRIRPILVILCAKALGYEGEDHIKLATIIEYIHTATLLHDDVVDLSTMRRGRPTANAEYGNAPTVLVGDFIYSRSFQLMVQLARMDIMRLMSETTNRIAAGEVLQLAKAGQSDTNEAVYFDIIERKTAILFEAACEAAAILCDSDDTAISSVKKYGYHVGMAFQLIDDYLDYTGDPALMGKNVGDDLAEGKATLPLILAMKQASDADAELVARVIENKDVEQISAVIDVVNKTQALQDTLALAQQHRHDAETALSGIGDSEFKQQLLRIAELAVERAA